MVRHTGETQDDLGWDLLKPSGPSTCEEERAATWASSLLSSGGRPGCPSAPNQWGERKETGTRSHGAPKVGRQTVPGAQGMEKAIAKGSGGGQNSNHRTGVPGPPACTGKGLLGCGPRGQQGSSTERKRGNEDRMTPVPSQGTPVEGARVLNGGGARASQVGCWAPEWE